jgi:uncharacterized membrane protein YdjX (TVP38/TMEM64 family)
MEPAEERSTDKRDDKGGLWKPALLLAVVVAVMLLSHLFGVGDHLKALQGWIREQGHLGPLAFILLYAVATVAALPGSVMSLFAGAVFGPVVGVIAVIVGATIGASLAFLVSRYFARDAVARWLSAKEKFRQLDELTERQGAIMVAITRLVPLFPFNLLNFGFGLTKVPFWTYAGWSFLCMLPGTILYVVGASAVSEAIAEGRIPWVLVVVVAIIVVIIAFLTKMARRRIGEEKK